MITSHEERTCLFTVLNSSSILACKKVQIIITADQSHKLYKRTLVSGILCVETTFRRNFGKQLFSSSVGEPCPLPRPIHLEACFLQPSSRSMKKWLFSVNPNNSHRFKMRQFKWQISNYKAFLHSLVLLNENFSGSVYCKTSLLTFSKNEEVKEN